jgi:hypothetical protein
MSLAEDKGQTPLAAEETSAVANAKFIYFACWWVLLVLVPVHVAGDGSGASASAGFGHSLVLVLLHGAGAGADVGAV